MRMTPRVAGFKSEDPAGLRLECMAGFVGIRTLTMPEKKIRVMISSRCNDVFDGAPLSDLRKRAKERIEAAKIFGSAAFEVWINEDAPPDDTSQDSLMFA